MKINVCIADDHPIVTNGLLKMLENEEEINLFQHYNNEEKLLNGLKLLQPDVLILGMEMQDIRGDELVKNITRLYPKIAILALTNKKQHYYQNLLFKNGAKGYLLKNADTGMLMDAITTLANGGQYLDKAFETTATAANQKEAENSKKEKAPTITKREIQVLELIADGLTSNQIAEKLFIALSTVENHRINLFLKLEVKNAVALVRKGLQLGIIR